MNENGSKWARAGLIGGVLASIGGNVANACLTETTVSILLRIPMALVWPLALFVAVEVLVRNRNVRVFLARLGQAGLLTVTVPTAITSFLNLHALMIKAGEPGIAQLTGPLAIDGLMLGCTVMMLAARVAAPVAMTVPRWIVGADGQTAVPADSMSEADIDAAVAAMDIYGRLSADTDTPPVRPATVPVIPGRVSAVRPVSPAGPRADASDVTALLAAWMDTPEDDRPSAADTVKLLAGWTGRSDRSVRRWMATALSA